MSIVPAIDDTNLRVVSVDLFLVLKATSAMEKAMAVEQSHLRP